MSHCEWRLITDEQKSGEPIFIWHHEELDMAWWQGDGFYCEAVAFGSYRIKPQPKYYLAVTPPPEE